MGFGERMMNLLQEYSMSQKKLAAELHIAPTTLNGYIREQRQPDFRTLIQIAEYFEVTTDYLLGFSDLRHKIEPPLSVAEEGLLGLYRNIPSDKQDMLLEQAGFFHQQEAQKRMQLRAKHQMAADRQRRKAGSADKE